MPWIQLAYLDAQTLQYEPIELPGPIRSIVIVAGSSRFEISIDPSASDAIRVRTPEGYVAVKPVSSNVIQVDQHNDYND